MSSGAAAGKYLRPHHVVREKPMSDTEIRSLMNRLYQSWADNDADAFAAFYTDGATVVLPGVFKQGSAAQQRPDLDAAVHHRHEPADLHGMVEIPRLHDEKARHRRFAVHERTFGDDRTAP